MASVLLRAKRAAGFSSAMTATAAISRAFASLSVGSDIISAAPNVALQKARTWDEGIASKFSTTPLKDIFQVLIYPLFLANSFIRRVQLSSFFDLDVLEFTIVVNFRGRKLSSLDCR